MKTSGDPSTGAFPEALRAAIAARNVTLVWLRNRLADRGSPVSLTTLSYWRSGRRNPEGAGSLAAVEAIEELLGTPAGQLSGHLRSTRRTGPLPPPRMPIGDDALRQDMTDSLAAVGAPPLTTLRDLSTHVVADIDQHGCLRRRQIRMLVQATSGTLARLAWVEVSRSPTTSAPRLTEMTGARLGPTHDHPNQMIRAYALELEREVAAPDTALVEWSTDFDEDYPAEPELGHFVARPAREVMIWVRFHPDRLPRWCEEQVDGEAARPLKMYARTIHATRNQFGPGVLNVRWGF